MKVDLHIHTTASDGECAPEATLELALKGGIRVLAIADHDTVAGTDGAAARLAEKPEPALKLVPAVEFSTSHEGTELHILGYFPQGVAPALREFLSEVQAGRRGRIERGIENLNRIGVPITYEQVSRLARGKSIGRAHLARALVAAGNVPTFADAFDRYLGSQHDIVPSSTASTLEVIRAIREDWGGVAVWAHPPIALVDSLTPTFADAGLEGLEIYGTKRRTGGAQSLYLEAVADAYGLLRSAGSDWHGWRGGARGRHEDLAGVSISVERIGPFLLRLGIRPQDA